MNERASLQESRQMRFPLGERRDALSLPQRRAMNARADASMHRFLSIFLVALLAGPTWANEVADMRLIGDAERTRFIVDLEKSPDFGVLRLANPYRLVVDLPDVEFRDSKPSTKGRGLVSDYRYGLIAPGKGRIVLDLAGPVEVVNTFVLDPVDPEPARLVIDLVPTTVEAFAVAAAKDRPLHDVASEQAEQPPPRPGKQVVVIDAGHGGIDSGAVGKDGVLEKDITLRFALELARQLRLGGELEPVLTRSSDDFLSLSARVEAAHRNHAVFFVSIHADRVPEDYVRGATVYTLSDDASDALAAAFADRENRADILAGLAIEDQPDEVADILFDLARRETRNLSVRFAKELVGDMRPVMPLNSNPWRRASFMVLKAPEVPSVLLELGYLSNAEDEALFASPEWPKREAQAIARAIENFFGENVAAGQ
jgi:N-acetylmuramoyl-L-alanine amidase